MWFSDVKRSSNKLLLSLTFYCALHRLQYCDIMAWREIRMSAHRQRHHHHQNVLRKHWLLVHFISPLSTKEKKKESSSPEVAKGVKSPRLELWPWINKRANWVKSQLSRAENQRRRKSMFEPNKNTTKLKPEAIHRCRWNGEKKAHDECEQGKLIYLYEFKTNTVFGKLIGCRNHISPSTAYVEGEKKTTANIANEILIINKINMDSIYIRASIVARKACVWVGVCEISLLRFRTGGKSFNI